jgi:hypothetical protein
MSDLEKVRNLREQLMRQHVDSNIDKYADIRSQNYPPNQIQLLGDKEI